MGYVRAGKLPSSESHEQLYPFEAWVNGAEQPRGLGAVAKTLSMDMRANDPAWLRLKFETLAKTSGDDAFAMPFPPHGEKKLMPSLCSAVAQLVRWRCEQLNALPEEKSGPVLDAMFSLKEPKTGADGTMSWTVDVLNPGAVEGDDVLPLGVIARQLDGGLDRLRAGIAVVEAVRAFHGRDRRKALGERDHVLVIEIGP